MNLFVFFLSLGLVITPVPTITANAQNSTVNVYVQREYREDVYEFNVDLPDGNTPIDVAYGTFDGSFQALNASKQLVTFYRFKSYDNEVFWCLEEKDMSFIPINGKPYILAYYQNGTTKYNHTCPKEYECDCYCYDDVFLGVYEL